MNISMDNPAIPTKKLTISEKIDVLENGCNNESELIKALFNLDSNSDNSNSKIYRDLDFDRIFANLDTTKTLYGKLALADILHHPTDNIALLKSRQINMRKIGKHMNQMEKLLTQIGETEKQTMWFWNTLSEDFQSIYDLVYFKIYLLDAFINRSETILNIFNIYKIFAIPLMAILTPILSIIIPYCFLYYMGFKMSLVKYVKMFVMNIYQSANLVGKIFPKYSSIANYSAIFITGLYFFLYLQSGYISVTNAVNINRIINIFHRKICVIARVVTTADKMAGLCRKMGLQIAEGAMGQIEYFRGLLADDIFYCEPKLFNNKGKILATYHKFCENKDMLISILKFIAQCDMYVSLAKLYHERNFTLAKYIGSGKDSRVSLKCRAIWHPLIGQGNGNNISFAGEKRNILITGPNKAGKSTFIKSVAIGVLLSQTIGLANAGRFSLTPFASINSYLNIPDNVGHESLFEAEMYRAKDHIRLLDSGGKSFIVMDELFTSTNYKEGYSAAYAIIKKLASYPNGISIITTHFTGLKDLEAETDGKIRNYHFSATRDGKNKIVYPYKLKTGHSEQYIALELLAENGFDKDILDMASSKLETIL